jgi:CelD/BcsL family acetyltransferase involved in cellulose biosynthesis
MNNSVKYLDKDKAIRIVCITKGDRIVAIAPLRKSYYRFGDFRYSTIEPLNYRNSDYTGLIIAENEAECLDVLLRYLYSKKDWDFFYLYDIPETSIVSELLTRYRSAFPKFDLERGRICPYITLPSSMDTLMQGLSAKFRKNLRRSMKKLETDFGKVELKKHDDVGSVATAMQIFFDLHQKRWTLKGEPGNYNTLKAREKAIDSAKLFAERGWLALYFLTVNDEPVAAQFCLEYKQKMHYGLGGFDPVYSSYSVGDLITMKVIEKCIQKKIREYDFMKGDELYKFCWTQEYRRNLRITFVNRSFTSRLFRLGIRTTKRMRVDKLLGKRMQF